MSVLGLVFQLREGVKKKIEKKVGKFQLSVFDPPPESWKKSFGTPPFSPTPLRNGKNFFAFLDVLDHLEAKKNEKETSLERLLPCRQGTSLGVRTAGQF